MPEPQTERRSRGRRAGLLALVAALPFVAGAEPPSVGPDFFLVVIDTARPDAFRTWNADVPVGDALAGLARDGIVFERLRAPAPWTRPSVASLLTGLPPAQHRVGSGLDRLSTDLPTLATLLQDAGYRTRGWSGNTQTLPLFGFGAGFDEYVDLAGHGTRRHPEARAIFDAVRSAVAESPAGGAFYYIHIVDPHYPYTPPSAHLEALGGSARRGFEPARGPEERDPNRSPVRYLAEVRDADTELGRFLDFLRETGRYEPAMILVVSDHGEELRDHGEQGHGHSLYEELLRVPGVLKLPGNARAGTRVARDVELQDLAVTVARFLPIAPPPDSPGIDALDPTARAGPRAYLSDDRRLAAVRDGSWKLIVDYADGGEELYDLARDPAERRDLAAAAPARVAALRAVLDRIQTRHAAGWHVRGCGCRGDPKGLAFRVEGLPGEPSALDLEADDRVAAADGSGVSIAFDLSEQLLTERDARTGRAVTSPDRDEVALGEWPAGSGAPTLRIHADGAPVAIGTGDPARREGPLELEAVRERAAVHASEPISCEVRGRACEPYLRVWYARPPVALREAELDPGVAERLRALGYTW